MFNMTQSDLAQAVESFALLAQNLRDEDLDRPWDWHGHNEGARFLFFRVYEELRALQTQVFTRRISQGLPLNSAQELLASQHQAYWQLQAVLLNGTAPYFDQAPSPGEWAIRETLRHIIRTEQVFVALVHYHLDLERRGVSPAFDETRAFLKEYRAQFDHQHQVTMQSSLEDILALFSEIHYHGLADLCQLSDQQLDLPSYFWEPQPFPIRSRLGRMDSHVRQHTIQIEKTLAALQIQPSETQRLLAMVYSAVAGLEAVSLGAESVEVAGREQTTLRIAEATEALAVVITQ